MDAPRRCFDELGKVYDQFMRENRIEGLTDVQRGLFAQQQGELLFESIKNASSFVVDQPHLPKKYMEVLACAARVAGSAQWLRVW